jgi:hypothetical protein
MVVTIDGRPLQATAATMLSILTGLPRHDLDIIVTPPYSHMYCCEAHLPPKPQSCEKYFHLAIQNSECTGNAAHADGSPLSCSDPHTCTSNQLRYFGDFLILFCSSPSLSARARTSVAGATGSLFNCIQSPPYSDMYDIWYGAGADTI